MRAKLVFSLPWVTVCPSLPHLRDHYFELRKMRAPCRCPRSPQILAGRRPVSANTQDSNRNVQELAHIVATFRPLIARLFAERVVAGLLSVLGMLALVLAAVGLYSVLAYAVSERTHEFGIRMALGAPRRAVLGLVLREGLVLALPGLVAGVAAAIAGARLVSSKLNLPLGLAEPSVFAWAALVLIVVTLLASYVPAHRATKVDPMTALRAE